jgi:RNA polymerase sigma factor (sigma-70 family)
MEHPDEGWLREVALPIVRSVAWRLCSGAWREDKEDMIQEAMTAIWAEKINEPGIVATVAKKRMLDFQRSWNGRSGTAKYSKMLEQYSLDQEISNMGKPIPLKDAMGGVDERIDTQEDLLLVSALIEEAPPLKEREREVLARQIYGETLREIGTSWGVTESRACHLSQSARKKLRTAAERMERQKRIA